MATMTTATTSKYGVITFLRVIVFLVSTFTKATGTEIVHETSTSASASASTSTSARVFMEDNNNDNDIITNGDIFGLVEWLTKTTNDESIFGFFSLDAQEIQYFNHDDNDNDQNQQQQQQQHMFGIYAKRFIPKGEILAQIPLKFSFSSTKQPMRAAPPTTKTMTLKENSDNNQDDNDKDNNDDDDDEEEEEEEEKDENNDIFCETVLALYNEFEKIQMKGVSSSSSLSSSFFDPFIRYLFHRMQHGTMMPSTWSDAGKSFLMHLLGGNNYPKQQEQQDTIDDNFFYIPPGSTSVSGIIEVLDKYWYRKCHDIITTNIKVDNNNDDNKMMIDEKMKEFEQVAALIQQLVIDDGILIPIVDWYTHQNGNNYNVELVFLDDDELYQISARRDISVGEQLHYTYNPCDANDDNENDGYDDYDVENEYHDYTQNEYDHTEEDNGEDYFYEAKGDNNGSCNPNSVALKTLQIFQYYGFIEDYPQSFSFKPYAFYVSIPRSDGNSSARQFIQMEGEFSVDFGIVQEEEEKKVEKDVMIENDKNNSNDNKFSPTLKVRWADYLDMTDTKNRQYIQRIFRKELQRLLRFQNILYHSHDNNSNSALFPLSITNNDDYSNIPPGEWKSIQKLFISIKGAFQLALHSISNDFDDAATTSTTASTTGSCIAGESMDIESTDGTCIMVTDPVLIYETHYDDLMNDDDHGIDNDTDNDEDEDGNSDDDLQYFTPNCPTSDYSEYIQYRRLDEFQTNYQKLSFSQRKKNGTQKDDICMELDETLQICSSYRPHYHEFFVHYPARYIVTNNNNNNNDDDDDGTNYKNNLKRVIFIGGGDSMLLHEILQYPSLEKVVGLELDQQVTRNCFKYFHSQPHFDKYDKVEWWFGDATKSLPLLPRDYWGSFDLVLVDLSETVMAMTVTKDLDIFSVLSLLLEPTNGIMVKNEFYLQQFSQFFDYSAQIFYGSPKLCTQSLTLGSHGVDFLHNPVSENEEVVNQRLLMESLDNNPNVSGGDGDEEKGRFKYLHDFVRKNPKSTQKNASTCDGNVNTINNSEDKDEDVVIYGNQAGILEIIEAENTSIPLNDQELLQNRVRIVIDEYNLTLVTDPIIGNDVIIFVLVEGYIVLRVWPEKQYIGMDLNMWGGFQKREQVRFALAKSAVGSTLVSTFKIVVGGMYGTKTWEDDKNHIGIRTVTKKPNCDGVIDQKVSVSMVESSTKNGSTGTDFAIALPDATITALISAFAVNKKVVVAVACGYEEDDNCASLSVLSKNPSVSKVVPIWTCRDLARGVDATTDDYDGMYKCERSLYSKLEEEFGEESGKDKAEIFIIDSSTSYRMAQIFQSLWSPYANRKAWLAGKYLFVAPILDDSSESTSWRRNILEKFRQEKHPHPVSLAEVVLENSPGGMKEVGFFSVNNHLFFDQVTVFERVLQDLLKPIGENVKVETRRIRGGEKSFHLEYHARVFEPDSYDVTPAVQQNAEQVSLGRQSVVQFEFQPPIDTVNDSLRSISVLSSNLQATFAKLDYLPLIFKEITAADGIGDGGVIVSIFVDGSVSVLVWDGRSHVDLNLFSRGDDSASRANLFVDTLIKISGLQRTLRDDHPRGTGRVIEFSANTEI